MPLDVEIVAGLRAGDAGACAEVVDAWAPGLYRLAAALLPSGSDADAIVRAAWLAALADLDAFNVGEISLKAWTYRRLLDRLPAIPEITRAERGSAADCLLDGRMPVPWTRLPPAVVVTDKIACLPVRYRVVVLLRDGEQFAPRDVSWLLSISLEDQRVLLHAARAALRAAIDAYFAGEV